MKNEKKKKRAEQEEQAKSKGEMTSSKLIAESILREIGVVGLPKATLSFSTQKSLFRTPFLCEAAAVGVCGALGLEASILGGVDDADQVIYASELPCAAAIRQERYMRRNVQETKLWDQLSGLYKGGDSRWIQFHCNFAHHRDSVLQVLGLGKDATKAQVEEQVLAHRDLFKLEELMTNAGACVAVVRSPDEWARHPQALAVEQLPLLEVIPVQAKGSPIERTPAPSDMVQPGGLLDGIKCLDFSRVLAGPMAGRTLADFGANVMRISSPKLPYVEAAVLATGHGKRTAHIDLETREGTATLAELLPETDVLINAYRPGCMNKHGLGTQELLEKFPGLVVVEISAYSHEGPWREKRGFDSLLQCVTGLVWEHSEAIGAETPTHLPVQLLDHVTGYLGALGAMRALELRQSDPGKSFLVRLSLCQTARWLKNLGRKETGTWEECEDIPAELLRDLMITRDIDKFPGGGTLTTLDVPLKMSKLQPKVGKGPVALGYHEPRWFSR